MKHQDRIHCSKSTIQQIVDKTRKKNVFGSQFTGKKDQWWSLLTTETFTVLLFVRSFDTILTQLFGPRFFVHTANTNQYDRAPSQLENWLNNLICSLCSILWYVGHIITYFSLNDKFQTLNVYWLEWGTFWEI